MTNLERFQVYDDYLPTKTLLKNLDVLISYYIVYNKLAKINNLLTKTKGINSNKPHQELIQELSDIYYNKAMKNYKDIPSLKKFNNFYYDVVVNRGNENFKGINFYDFIDEYCKYWEFELTYKLLGMNTIW